MIETSNGVSTSKTTQIDQWGRPTEYQQITDGQTYTSSYQYNLSGALIQETYPSGRVVKNTFDSNGDLARIHGKANSNATERTYANSFKFLPDGRIERLRVGNGLWEKAKFNDRLQVTEFGLGRGAENMNLWKLNLEYGELQANGTVDKSKNTGNLAKQTISFDGLPQPFEQTYKYDSLYRITEAKETNNGNQTWVQNFGYDRYGNRTTLSQNILGQQLAINKFTHPTIDPNTNRFDAGQDYSYDKVGNLVGDADNRSFTFDGNNKQILVTNLNSQSVGEYFYDGDGKRVKKKSYVGGILDETVIFVYSNGKLVEEFSTKAPPSNPQTKYVATDHLQSIRALSNQDGEIVSRRDFMPFGEELQADSSYRKSNLKYNSDDVRQKFTGYEKDEETGLDFAQARMYNNQHARFTAVDPLLASGKSGNPQTFNRYVYVMNSPLQYTDPTGLQAGWTVDFRKKSPSGEETSWVYFRYFENDTFRDTYNAVNGTNFKPFAGEYYIYGDNYFAHLSGEVYLEGRISTKVSDEKIAELKSLQKKGNTEAVDKAMRILSREGFALSITANRDSVTPEPIKVPPLPPFFRFGRLGFGQTQLPPKEPTIGPPKPPTHSVYKDGQKVLKEQRPARLGKAERLPESQGPHTALRIDTINNNRIYQGRTFNSNGHPLYDIDFTIPTFPNGVLRPNHNFMEFHPHTLNQPHIGPRGGFFRWRQGLPHRPPTTQ